ncbi:MAG: hypothetical protein QXH24_03585 [Candidatus Bathyarchaeia archaeon]
MIIKETILYNHLSGGRVQCNICARRCIIPKNETGYCIVRKNIEGKTRECYLWRGLYGLI